MARRKLVEVVRYLRRLTNPDNGSGASDAELLERYVRCRDEAAFELLLWRHAALVYNVCRRVLPHEEDAEDAFQATFLTFVRKAASISRRASVSSWLYKVAYRVALQARARIQRTAARETAGAEGLAMQSSPDLLWNDLRPLLDEEVNRLPEWLRQPFVLCYLEGKTNEEAARELGCRLGTIYSRLSRGRELLRRRLTRRGVTLSTAVLTAALLERAAAAVPATTLVLAAVRAALSFAGPLTGHVVSPRVAALAEGALRAMFVTKIKIVGLMVFVVGLCAAGGVLTHTLPAASQTEARAEDPPPKGEADPKADAKPISVRVVKPTPGGLERAVREAAEVVAAEQVDMVPRISGTVKELVDLGDRVKKGQLLAVLDAPLAVKDAEQASAAVELAKGRILEAEASVATAQAEMQAAKGLIGQREKEVEAAKAAQTFREQHFKRFQQLLETKAIDARLVEEYQQQFAAAQAQYQAAQAAVVNARSDVAVKDSKVMHAKAVLRSAQANLAMVQVALDKARLQENFARLVAPFDGVVTQRSGQSGSYIDLADRRGQLLTLTRMDRVRVVVRIPGIDAALVERGDPVDLDIESLPGSPITGQKIARFSPVIDPRNRTMRVEIDVANPKQVLLPGMHGEATIRFKSRSPVGLIVPLACLLKQRNRAYVFIVRDGRAHRVDVEGTDSDGTNAVISKGIKASDLVIANNQGELADGMPVKVEKAP